jgi:hypothetical protein
MGAAMGFTPAQVDDMTLWEFSACADGWALSKGAKKSAQMKASDYDALVALGDSWNKAAGDGRATRT